MRIAVLALASVLAAGPALAQSAQGLPPARSPAHTAEAPQRQQPMMGMRSMDANQDGAVSREEFMAAHQGMSERFQAMDLDRDQAVSKQEFLKGAEERRERRFEALDANQDGRLTQDELEARRAAMFDAMDTNRDGRITPEEMRHHGGRQMPQQSQTPD